jgi:hypothetical protein
MPAGFNLRQGQVLYCSFSITYLRLYRRSKFRRQHFAHIELADSELSRNAVRRNPGLILLMEPQGICGREHPRTFGLR